MNCPSSDMLPAGMEKLWAARTADKSETVIMLSTLIASAEVLEASST